MKAGRKDGLTQEQLEKAVLEASNDSRMQVSEIARKFEIPEAEVDRIIGGNEPPKTQRLGGALVQTGEVYMDGHGYKIDR